MNLKKLAKSASLAGGSLLVMVQTALGQDEAINLSLNSDIFPDESRRSFGSLFSFFIRLLFVLGGILMLIYLIAGGIRYITSGGDKAQAQNARDMITNALIGIIIIASSYAIATLLNTLFGIDVFNATISVPTSY